MTIPCSGPHCKIRLGRHRPGKVILSPTGELIFTRAEDAEDIRHARRRARLAKTRPEPAPELARPDVLFLPHDDPRLTLGGYRQRHDGSFRWVGR
jgi:hypothetical protein